MPATQICRDCGKEFPYSADRDRCEKCAPTSTFDRYIAQGAQAIATHPDYDELQTEDDPETAASDTIASILHAVYGHAPLSECEVSAMALLDKALRCFTGDYEDRR